MIKYKIQPEGSEKWSPAAWQKWYREYNENVNDMPTVLGKLMMRALEKIRKVIATKYLTKSAGGTTKGGITFQANPGELHVRTGRGRASVHYLITRQDKQGVEGQIGSNVWYMRMHHEGGIFAASRAGGEGYTLQFRRRPWLEKGVEDPESVNYITALFEKAGLQIFMEK